jgi:hypothetical protein
MRYQVERSNVGNRTGVDDDGSTIGGVIGTMSRTQDRTAYIDLCDVVDMQRVVSQRVVCTARRPDAVLIAGVLNAADSDGVEHAVAQAA